MTTGALPEVRVERVVTPDDEVLAALGRLVPQLSSSSPPPDGPALAELVAAGATSLLVATRHAPGGEREVLGTLSLVLYRIPTGTKALVEDVVVDAAARGQGVATALIREAVRIAAESGAKSVDLTSRPEREAANRLYRSLGFEERATNVYRYKLGIGGSAATGV